MTKVLIDKNRNSRAVQFHTHLQICCEILNTRQLQAIRENYCQKIVAVVTIPKDLSWAEIDNQKPKTPKVIENDFSQAINHEDIENSLKIIKEAIHPLIYAGQGLRVQKILWLNSPSQSGFELLHHADLILFLGSEFPFAGFWPKGLKNIEVNNNPYYIVKTVDIDYALINTKGQPTLGELLRVEDDEK